MFEFNVLRQGTTEKNAMGQVTSDYAPYGLVEGYMDMLSGNEAISSNSLIEESSHVLITWDIDSDITNMDRIENPRTKEVYEITFVDNVMELGQLLEVYCKKVT